MLDLKSTGLLLACGTAVGTSFATQASANPKRPNIVLVMADDQGWGDMHYNNHPVIQTPAFDEAARSALCFNRFYAAAPLSSPTRGSVLTGRHPNRYGVFKFGEPIRPQEQTIAQLLRTGGYRTGHFGKWHLGSVFKGSPVNPGAMGFDEWTSAPNFFDNDPLLSRMGKAVEFKGESSTVTVDEALDFIGRCSSGGKPFFAVVWFGSPHAPWIADEESKTLYKTQEEKLQNYYGEITAMDKAFGKLRKELRSLGVADNTILWYCSDNGGVRDVSLSGGRGYKQSIYEGGLRVPSIFEWPVVIKKQADTNVPCSTSDIMPTLLDIAGISMPAGLQIDGESIAGIIMGKSITRSGPLCFWQYPGGGKVVPSDQIMRDQLERQRKGIPYPDSLWLDLNAGIIEKKYPDNTYPGHAAIMRWPLKLHRIEDQSGTVTVELYDLDRDGMEANNIAGTDTLKTNVLLRELCRWQKSVVHSLNGDDYK